MKPHSPIGRLDEHAVWHADSRRVRRFRSRATGYGETQPLDKGANAKARARNRRIDFVIVQRQK